MRGNENFNDILKFAEQGDAESQLHLGVMYARGEGVAQDYQQAFKWYKKAAAQGEAEAQSRLGGMYASGQGIAQDYEEALKWFMKAAEGGHVLAQTGLGVMYAKGEGVAQDYEEALKWFRKASAQDEAEAQCWLGLMYDTGLGVAKNRQEALKWYRKAAEQGHARAQFGLGARYLQFSLGESHFVTEDCREFEPRIDNIEAYKWLILAAAQGNQHAVDFKNVLKQKMTAEEIAEAQKLAKKFKPKINNSATLKADETKWPGIVLLIILLVIASFIPQNTWWGVMLFCILMGMVIFCLCVISAFVRRLIFGLLNLDYSLLKWFMRNNKNSHP